MAKPTLEKKTPQKNLFEKGQEKIQQTWLKASKWLEENRAKKPDQEAKKTQKSAFDRIAVLAPTIILGLGSIGLNVNQARIDGKLPDLNTIAKTSTENVIIAKNKALTFVGQQTNGKLLPTIPKSKNFKEIKLTKDQQKQGKELGIIGILTASATGIAGMLDNVRSKLNNKKTTEEKKEKEEKEEKEEKALKRTEPSQITEEEKTTEVVAEILVNQEAVLGKEITSKGTERLLGIGSQEDQDNHETQLGQEAISQELIPEIEEVGISPLQEAINNKRQEFEGDEEGFDMMVEKLPLGLEDYLKISFIMDYNPNNIVPNINIEVLNNGNIISEDTLKGLQEHTEFSNLMDSKYEDISNELNRLNTIIALSQEEKNIRLLAFLQDTFDFDSYGNDIEILHKELVKKLDSNETITIRSHAKFEDITRTEDSEIYTWYEQNKKELSDFYTGKIDKVIIEEYLVKAHPELIKPDRDKIYALLKVISLKNNDGLFTNIPSMEEAHNIEYKKVLESVKDKVLESLEGHDFTKRNIYIDGGKKFTREVLRNTIATMFLNEAIGVNDREALMEEIINKKLDEIVVAKEQEVKRGREAIKNMVKDLIIRKHGSSESYSDEIREKVSDDFSQKQNNDPEIAKIINEAIEELQGEAREIKVERLSKIRERLTGVHYPVLDNYEGDEKDMIGTYIKMTLGYNLSPTEFKDLLNPTIENLQEEAKKIRENKKLEEKKYQELKEEVKKDVIKKMGSKEIYSLEEQRKLFETVRYNITVTTLSTLEKEDLLKEAIKEVQEEAKQVRIKKEKNGRDMPITMPNI